MAEKIWVSVIEDRMQGEAYVFAGKTEAAMTHEMAEYCRRNWERATADLEDIASAEDRAVPAGDEDCVEAYFHLMREYGGDEHVLVEGDRIVVAEG